ncbi:hypothetical protein [Hymenobacter ruber]
MQQLATWVSADTASLFPIDSSAARTILQVWLGFERPPLGGFNPNQTVGSFPLNIPPAYLVQARTLHEQQLTDLNQTHLSADELIKQLGVWWRERGSASLPLPLRELAALQYADFLLARPHLLRPEHLCDLLPLLGSTPQALALQSALPPTEPTDLPITASPAAVLSWATTQYLPYRRWQSDFSTPPAVPTARIATLAGQFEDWILTNYPALLVGSNTGLLHIQQAEGLRFARTREVTLWVVPDGLGWLDAQALAEHLHTASAGRLDVPKSKACLGLLPTITSLTKKPLLNSTTARGLSHARPNDIRRERLIAGHLNPADHLRDAQPGDLFIWTPPDPDSAYHAQFDRSTIQQRVSQLLKVLAQQLSAAAQAVPITLPFRIVVSTDHGRQLGTSARTVAVPTGFESHGRAAYPTNGKSAPLPTDRSRPDLAWLEPEAFGLPHWAAAVRGEDSFRTNNTDSTGTLLFPHGGLWPEEVVVPWLVVERVAPALPLTARLTGHGLARRRGQATITLVNPTPQAYMLVSLDLNDSADFAATVSLANQSLPATANHTHAFFLESWPTPAQTTQLRARLVLQDAEGRQFTYSDIVVLFTSEDFESAPDLDLNF